MQKRLNFKDVAPNALRAMIGVEAYLSKASISEKTKELIKIRASQINGCAYCINTHTQDAIKNGETNQRIFLLNVWKEVEGIFTEEEKVVLAITEEMTLIHQNGLSDKTYSNALQFFSETQIADIMTSVIAINLWNRVVLSTHLQFGESLA
ncbi:carboxymuconolactone decarboxylase family protein [Flectobacillus roseus]